MTLGECGGLPIEARGNAPRNRGAPARRSAGPPVRRRGMRHRCVLSARRGPLQRQPRALPERILTRATRQRHQHHLPRRAAGVTADEREIEQEGEQVRFERPRTRRRADRAADRRRTFRPGDAREYCRRVRRPRRTWRSARHRLRDTLGTRSVRSRFRRRDRAARAARGGTARWRPRARRSAARRAMRATRRRRRGGEAATRGPGSAAGHRRRRCARRPTRHRIRCCLGRDRPRYSNRARARTTRDSFRPPVEFDDGRPSGLDTNEIVAPCDLAEDGEMGWHVAATDEAEGHEFATSGRDPFGQAEAPQAGELQRVHAGKIAEAQLHRPVAPLAFDPP